MSQTQRQRRQQESQQDKLLCKAAGAAAAGREARLAGRCSKAGTVSSRQQQLLAGLCVVWRLGVEVMMMKESLMVARAVGHIFSDLQEIHR